MLKVFLNIGQLDFRKLMDVYEETNRITGRTSYPKKPENLQMLFAEQDFYQYLEMFFEDSEALCAVWDEECAYMAALRLEKYDDGFIVTALEVPPVARRKGYATKLLRAVTCYAAEHSKTPIYSHIQKQNLASIATHKKCGFCLQAEDAVFLDGSYQKDYYTFIWK